MAQNNGFSSSQFFYLAHRKYMAGKRGKRFPIAPGVFIPGLNMGFCKNCHQIVNY